uniref:Uncharacterized protein n=1 Tax=Anguilla anguilla TaxID=7936 RepID=A0A0E9TU00_ANGAN
MHVDGAVVVQAPDSHPLNPHALLCHPAWLFQKSPGADIL